MNKAMRQAFFDSTEMSFEVLCVCNNLEETKKKESDILLEVLNDPLTLNRSFGDVNSGIKWTSEEKKKISEGMKASVAKRGGLHKAWTAVKRESRLAKKVVIYNLLGDEVRKYKSVNEAARDLGLNHRTIIGYIENGKTRQNKYSEWIFKIG